jgi:hypothetical protein
MNSSIGFDNRGDRHETVEHLLTGRLSHQPRSIQNSCVAVNRGLQSGVRAQDFDDIQFFRATM